MATKPIVRKVVAKLTLPTEINEPSDNLLDYFLMVFGRKNVGKSTFSSSYPEAINYQLERGRRNLPILMVPKKGEPPLTYSTMEEYLKRFCESKLRVGVIDTLDAWYDLIYLHVLESYGITKPSDGGNGPEVWNEIKYTLDGLIGLVQDAGKTLVFVSHEKTREHSNADGTVLERIEPSCSGQAIGVVQRYCDFVFHYDWVTNDRVLTLRSTDNAVWTSCGRNDMFLDVEGKPLNRIKIPNDPDVGFSTLEAAFNGRLRDYDWEPPKKKVVSINKSTGQPAKKLIPGKKK